MPETSREAYLAELDAMLPFPTARRAEILEEISTHLDDAAADGSSEARAQARLGTPLDLARELSRPEQTPMRLLAAAGAGVRAAVGPWLYGYLLAALVVSVGLWTLAALLMLISSLVARDLALSLGGGWGTAATAIPIAVALCFAARAATTAASIAARRVRSDVEPWVAGVGTTLAASIVLFVWGPPQNAASVVALAIAPFGVVIGAYRPTLIPARPRIAPIAAVAATLVLIGLGVITYFVAPPSMGFADEMPAQSLEERTAIVGPNWAPLDAAALFEANGFFTEGGTVRAEWQPREPGLLDGFSDLRLEAWHAQDAANWLFDSAYREPFAIGPVEREGNRLVGSVVTDRDPEVDGWHLVLTGRAPDGVRYVLDASGSGQSTFQGTAWDWVVAVAD